MSCTQIHSSHRSGVPYSLTYLNEHLKQNEKRDLRTSSKASNKTLCSVKICEHDHTFPNFIYCYVQKTRKQIGLRNWEQNNCNS